MHSVTSNAVASEVANRATTYNINNTFGQNATLKNRPSEKIATFNFFDTTKTGLSIDIDYQNGQIRAYYVLNGITQNWKTVYMS